MSDFTNKLASFVGAELEKPVQKVNKDDLKEVIQTISTRMSTIENLYSVLPSSDINSFTQKINDGMKDKFFLGLYTKIALKFTKPEDRKYAFAGFINTAKAFNVVFNNILRAIDEVVKTREITIFNARISHAALFGIIRQADAFADYTLILFNGVLSDVISRNGVTEVDPPNKAEIAKLTAAEEFIITIVNNFSVINPTSLTNLVKYIAFTNDTLVDDEKKPNVSIDDGNLSASQKHFIQYGFGALSYIFRTLGQWRNVAKANQIKKSRDEQEWMKERLSLLQMDLSGMDPDSAQYRNTVKSIAKYTKMIEDTQAKIDKYEAK